MRELSAEARIHLYARSLSGRTERGLHTAALYGAFAMIAADANSVYNGEGDILKSVRNQAARVGANGVVIDSLGTSHATVKILGAALGGRDAERKASAIAIWMPSDTARVREACGG